MSRFRFILGAGLLVVLCEGLLRRAVPQIGLPVLAFKFVFFPLMYLLAPRVGVGSLFRFSPVPLLAFLGWGVVVTLVSMVSNPVRGGIGLLVNLSFIPLIAVGSVVYGDHGSRLRLARLVGAFSGCVGTLALLQTTLPRTHWMVQMTNQDLALLADQRIRVPGTFQFPTVFGNYVGLGLVFCGLWYLHSQSSREKVIAVVSGLSLYLGGLGSGSRIGGIGALMVLAVMLGTSSFARRPAVRVAVVLLTLLTATWLVSPDEPTRQLIETEERVWRTRDLGSRISGEYLGSNLSSAWGEAGFFGAGWGTLTIGADRYAALLGESAPPQNERSAEGGYPHILAETGLPGLVLFLLFLAWLLFDAAQDRFREARMVKFGAVTWFLLGNLPLSIQEISVLAIPWWLLLGIITSWRAEPRIEKRFHDPLHP